jgi:hypothetical protein
VAVLEGIIDDLGRLDAMANRRMGFCGAFGGGGRFAVEIGIVEAHLGDLLPAAFRAPVQPPLEPEILGYTLPFYHPTLSMGHALYRQFHAAWHRADQLSREELMEWLNDNCCAGWGKMDVQGEAFSGFWCSDDPEVRASALLLSRDTNLQALCSLPYPARAIMLSVDLGCGNGRESVPYTVLCCEWFQRKMAQMKDFPFHTYMFDEDDELRP